MFSLLPRKEKKELKKEYHLRLAVVVLSFSLILGLVSISVLIPSYLVSKSKEKEVAQRIESVKKSTIFEESEKINSDITKASLKINAFENFDSDIRVYKLFEEIVLERNSDIRIRGISFSKSGNENENKVSVSGIARDRDSLRSFARELETKDIFKSVNLPVSNFTKETNLDFSMELVTGF